MEMHSIRGIVMIKRNAMLVRRFAIVGAIAACGVAWSVAGVVHKPGASDAVFGATQLAAPAEKPVAAAVLHDEVEYFGEKFSKEQQQLKKQPVVETVLEY